MVLAWKSGICAAECVSDSEENECPWNEDYEQMNYADEKVLDARVHCILPNMRRPSQLTTSKRAILVYKFS